MKTYYISHDEGPVEAIEDGIALYEDLEKLIQFDNNVFSVSELKDIKYYKITIEEIELPDAKTN